MKVKCGDKVKVRRVKRSDSISLKVLNSEDCLSEVVFMTAPQARLLARKLNGAASKVEIAERGHYPNG